MHRPNMTMNFVYLVIWKLNLKKLVSNALPLTLYFQCQPMLFCSVLANQERATQFLGSVNAMFFTGVKEICKFKSCRFCKLSWHNLYSCVNLIYACQTFLFFSCIQLASHVGGWHGQLWIPLQSSHRSAVSPTCRPDEIMFSAHKARLIWLIWIIGEQTVRKNSSWGGKGMHSTHLFWWATLNVEFCVCLQQIPQCPFKYKC